MRHSVPLFIYVFGIVTNINFTFGGISNETEINYYKNFKYFFIEIVLDKCYQVYDENEDVTPFTCMNKIDPKKQLCINWLNNEKNCVGFKTPTNESIELTCNRNRNESLIQYYLITDTCFKLYKTGRKDETVCLEKIQNYSVGITTPDKFTILVDSYYCDTFTIKEQRDSYKNFINGFLFTPGTRSCFKIFSNDQQPTPYTCLSDDIHDSCLQQFPQHNNCYGIITQKNETIILQCKDNSKLLNNTNCFKIYDVDNNEYTSCIKKLEERCVGFTTPSNLTVLVECHFCSIPNVKRLLYNPLIQQKYRQFVEEYVNNEYLGKNSYLNETVFQVFTQKNLVRPTGCSLNGTFGYWIPNSSCYGITLENNETIVLECIGTNKTQLQPGCFKIIDSKQQEHSSCIEVLEERCVGITTPGKLYVVFACYEEYKCESLQKTHENIYTSKPSYEFILYPHLHNCYELYNKDQILEGKNICQKMARPENYACIDWIERRKQFCLGLKTPVNETIELICADNEETALSSPANNCFSVYRDDGNVTIICQRKFGGHNVGITTPSNYTVLLHSYFCSTVKSIQSIEQSKSFVENFSFDSDIRSCYKVYTEDQDVSPKNCLDKNIYESCVQKLTKTNCTGIITQNNETVVLNCSDEDEVVNGCFKIYTPDNKVHVSCQERLEESCVGIKTPSNLRILFDCLNCSFLQVEELPSYLSTERKTYRPFVEQSLQKYVNGNYTFQHKKTVKIARSDQSVLGIDCNFPISSYHIHKLHDYDDCFGVTMENHETIVLECPGAQSKKLGCFDVVGPINIHNNSPHRKVQTVCVKIINERCVGITTPGNWTMQLSCARVKAIQCSYNTINLSQNGTPIQI